ncbi:MAG TPA: nicotinate (nicotinamide) nucleotide adenylyltransferase [Candidatus Aquabacterium excrementipullorum]|nr:nicotinate (nicotinamide) nucleotide adenylyltransferase [Candidatus Aquabacterium excrementipullorum]
MGGSFDPVHTAHLALAHTALSHLGLDEVRWIPVGQPWQKARQLAAPAHRLAMVTLAIQDEPRFTVDSTEIRRDGPSYTLDTVRELQARDAGQADEQQAATWFLIIGQDQYANLPTWHGWRDLINRVTLAVACRGDQRPRPAPELADTPHRMVELPMPPMTVSSTDIRARLALGEPADLLAPTMVPPAVARYISNHQLYAPGAPR